MKKIILLVISIIACVTINAKPKTLWLVSDAAAANYTDSALCVGWGTSFQQYIHPRISFINLSEEGMSAKVFEATGEVYYKEFTYSIGYNIINSGDDYFEMELDE